MGRGGVRERKRAVKNKKMRWMSERRKENENI